MHEAEKLSLEQIQAFLSASEAIRFEGETQEQIYHWIEQVLGRQEYHQQGRQARGLLRSYLAKMTGRSRAQVTRLIARYRKSGSLQIEAGEAKAQPNSHREAKATAPVLDSTSEPGNEFVACVTRPWS